MARLILTIDDELDKQFRSEVSKRIGFKKGNLQKAAEEALRMWIESSNKV